MASAQQATVSRAEAASVLLQSRGIRPAALRNDGSVVDVEPGAWYERAVLTAVRLRLLTPDPYTKKVYPLSAVRRAEFLKMLAFTFELPQNTKFTYKDVIWADWFSPYAGLAERYRFFGVGPLLEPSLPVTPAEVTAAINVVLKDRAHTDQDKAEQQMSAEQAEEKLQLQLIISTRRIKVTFVQPPVPSVPALRPSSPALISPSLSLLRMQVIEYVNQARVLRGLPPLKYQKMLEQSAQAFAEDMAARGYFSHVSPEGTTLRDRIEATGYYDRSIDADCLCVRGYSLGENLARGQTTAKESFLAWMKSPSHREALLNPQYREIGIGVSAGVWVQHFGGVITPK